MKLTILGSGTAASQLPGIPNRYPPGFLVEWKENKLLLECSEGIRFRLEEAGHDYADIHHLAISHAHPDHYALAQYLLAIYCNGIWGETKNEFLNIYGPRQLLAEFPRLWQIYFPDLEGKYLDFPKLNLVSLPGNPVTIDNAILSAAKIHHGFGKIEALAFRLETPEDIFAYSGDTGDCQGIREISKNADIFVCECTARIGDKKAPTNYGHLNPYLAGEIAKISGVKKLVLFHYTGLDSNEAIIKDCQKSGFEGEIIMAKDFMVIET